MAPTIKSAVITILAFAAFAAASMCPAVENVTLRDTINAAKAVLDHNWVNSMNSTLPSPNLYPHQWSWDSAFIAIGYSHYDTQKAIDETNALFRGQWKNGLLPHIVFNPNAIESYFPGPKFWNIESSPNAPDHALSSGIVQPPVHAIASLSIYNNAHTPAEKAAALDHLRQIYPKLALWHTYLYTERDPHNEALVFIRHMWESGMDNSPAWDYALDAIKLTPDMIPAYQRVDKAKVNHDNERPTSSFYDRAVYLIKIFYDNAYDEAAIFEKSPFIIQDVLFNSILARAGAALAEIADILGFSNDAKLNRKRSARTAAAITKKLYDPQEKFYFDFDMVAKRLIPAKISGGFVALYGAKIDSRILKALVNHLYSPEFLDEDLSAWTIPSVSRLDPGYTNTTYWKGPTWLNINYLVRDGLIKNANGNGDALKIGEYLKDRSIEMVDNFGFYEYFNPISGSPHGGHHFSWSAALTIDWICNQRAEALPIKWFRHPDYESTRVIVFTLMMGLIALAVRSYLYTSLEKVLEISAQEQARAKQSALEQNPTSMSSELLLRTSTQ